MTTPVFVLAVILGLLVFSQLVVQCVPASQNRNIVLTVCALGAIVLLLHRASHALGESDLSRAIEQLSQGR